MNVQNSGLGTEANDKLIEKLKTELKAEKVKLTTKVKDATRQKNYRAHQKRKIEEIKSTFPEAAKILNQKSTPGRPCIEDNQPDFLKTIIDLATYGSGADDRRRTEMIRTCKTLDDVHDQLLKDGFKVSRSALYLRFVPRRSDSFEGKRHVKTVPVRLIKAQTSEHKFHVDTEFAKTTIRALESLASLLGPKQVLFLSQDDKARIPLGVTAVKKQAAVVMHMHYRVTLPDHDWVKAAKHKLIPSVYAGNIYENIYFFKLKLLFKKLS